MSPFSPAPPRISRLFQARENIRSIWWAFGLPQGFLLSGTSTENICRKAPNDILVTCQTISAHFFQCRETPLSSPSWKHPSLISEAEPDHHREGHFSCLDQGSYSFGHDLCLVRVETYVPEQHPHYCGQWLDPSVYLPLHPIVTHVQMLKVFLHLRQTKPLPRGRIWPFQHLPPSLYILELFMLLSKHGL